MFRVFFTLFFCQAVLASEHSSLNVDYERWPAWMDSFHELSRETLLEKDTVTICEDLVSRRAQELSINNEKGHDFMAGSTITLSFPAEFTPSILEKGFLNTHQRGGLSNGNTNNQDTRDLLEQALYNTRFPKLDAKQDLELIAKLNELRPKSAFLDLKWEKRTKTRAYGGMAAVFTSDKVKSRTIFTNIDSLAEFSQKWVLSGEKLTYDTLFLGSVEVDHTAGIKAFGTPLLTKGLSALPNQETYYKEAMICGELLASDAEYFLAGCLNNQADNQLDKIIFATTKLLDAGKKVKSCVTGESITRNSEAFAKLFIRYLEQTFTRLKILTEEEILEEIKLLNTYEIKLVTKLFPTVLEKLFKFKYLDIASLIIRTLGADDSKFIGGMTPLSLMPQQHIRLLNKRLSDKLNERELCEKNISNFRENEQKELLDGEFDNLKINNTETIEIENEIKKYQEFLKLIYDTVDKLDPSERQPFSIMSFNVYQNNWLNYNEIYEKNKNNPMAKLLKNTDILFTQEDSMCKIADFFPDLMLAGSSGESPCEKVSVYSQAPIRSVPYSTDHFKGLPKRNAVFAVIKGLKIANVHLSGGRFDDRLIKENIGNEDFIRNYIAFKLEPLREAINLETDIILGDYNSVFALSEKVKAEFYESQYAYFKGLIKRELSENEKKIIREINQAPYDLLIANNYTYAAPLNEGNAVTNYLGSTIIDTIWYKKDRVSVEDTKIIELFKKGEELGNPPSESDALSDHNPLSASVKRIFP
jgi:hypothetical protein